MCNQLVVCNSPSLRYGTPCELVVRGGDACCVQSICCHSCTHVLMVCHHARMHVRPLHVPYHLIELRSRELLLLTCRSSVYSAAAVHAPPRPGYGFAGCNLRSRQNRCVWLPSYRAVLVRLQSTKYVCHASMLVPHGAVHHRRWLTSW